MSRVSKPRQNQSAGTGRRGFLTLAGGALGWVLGGFPARASAGHKTNRILKRDDKIDVDRDPQEIAEKAYQLGHKYEKRYGGCAQCSLAALQDAIAFVGVDEDVFRAASCLDGGATPTGLQNCGAFTGCGMVIGYLCGRTRGDEFEGSTGLSHDLIHRVYKRFQQQYGSVLCKDVRKGAEKDCPEVVGRAARWTAEVLLEQFANQAQ